MVAGAGPIGSNMRGGRMDPPRVGGEPSHRSHEPRSIALKYEMKLHELVNNACNEDDLDPLTARSRKLACHVALLRELSTSNAFGPLNSIMASLTTELVESLYRDSALLLKLPPGDNTAFHIKPNFVALEDAKETIAEKDAANEYAWSAMREAQVAQAEAERRLHGEGPTSEETAAIIGKLEYDLHTCRGECDEMRANLHTVKMEMSREYLALEGEVQRWKQIASDAQRESEDLHRDKTEREQIRRAFADLQDKTSASRAAMAVSTRADADRTQDPEAAKLEDQLLVLQNARVKEYEETRRRTPKHLHLKIRDEFVGELKMVQGELSALRSYLGSVESGVAPPPQQPPRYQIPGGDTGGGASMIPSWDASRPATAAAAASGTGRAAGAEAAGGVGMSGGAGGGAGGGASALELEAAAAGLPTRALVQVSLDGGVLFEPLVGGAAVAELGGPPLALPPMATHVRLSPPPPRDEAALNEIQRELNKVGFFANGATQLPPGYAADERGMSRGGVGGGADVGGGGGGGVGASVAGSGARAVAGVAAASAAAAAAAAGGGGGSSEGFDGVIGGGEGGGGVSGDVALGVGVGGEPTTMDAATAAALGADVSADAAAFEHLNTPLWDRYRARATAVPSGRGVPKLPRRLTQSAVMEVIEEVLAARWEQLNNPDAVNVPDSLDGFFYEWLDRVYVLPETVVLVAFSVLAAVEEFWMVSSTVALFMKCMEGELDGATWQYTMHFRRLLTTHPMAKTSDFSDFAALLYPQAREDELLVLTSAFAVAITDAPNAAQVVDFLTGRLLAKDDLRLKRLIKVLKYKDTHHRGAFNKSEWVDMCGKMFPYLTPELAERWFDRAAARMEGLERVPIEPLARVACVLDTATILPPAVQEPEPTLKRNMLK